MYVCLTCFRRFFLLSHHSFNRNSRVAMERPTRSSTLIHIPLLLPVLWVSSPTAFERILPYSSFVICSYFCIAILVCTLHPALRELLDFCGGLTSLAFLLPLLPFLRSEFLSTDRQPVLQSIHERGREGGREGGLSTPKPTLLLS